VSCCEGRQQTLFVHWAPAAKCGDRARADSLRPPATGDLLETALLDPARWRTQPIPITVKRTRWMFAVPAQVDGRGGIDLFVGSKSPNGCVGWLQSPEQPRRLDRWRFHKLRQARWIMSLIATDIDGDGDTDLLGSDRFGPQRAIFWLENPGPDSAASEPWQEHSIAVGLEFMFIDYADIDNDGVPEVIAATQNGFVLIADRTRAGWSTTRIANPFGLRTGKSVRVGDMDNDRRPDIVISFEHATDPAQPGVALLRQTLQPDGTVQWRAANISGPDGSKFDLVQLLDLDGDGDLDVLTCEERENLGVVWYENRRAVGRQSTSHK